MYFGVEYSLSITLNVLSLTISDCCVGVFILPQQEVVFIALLWYTDKTVYKDKISENLKVISSGRWSLLIRKDVLTLI